MSKKPKAPKAPPQIPVSEIVDSMLADIAFTAPVEVEDCKAVYSAIKGALPASQAEVHFQTGKKGDHIVIRVDSYVRMVEVA